MKSILLVENDESVISQVSEALNNPDFNLLVVSSGIEGYDAAMKHLPVLIICSKDIYDGFDNDMLHKLREDTLVSNIPFIFLLSKNSMRKGKSSRNHGFDYYIIKPFATAEFIKIANLAIEKYEALNQKSEQRLEELRGSLSFALPHEFFTPLNGILGFTDILINDYENLTKTEVTQMLQFVHKDALRLKKLTENFLSFAQLEMIGKDPEKVQALRNSYFINPKDIIDNSARKIAVSFNRGSDLLLELEDAAIRVGEGYLQKVINELVNNAFKFSESGTPVIISALSNDVSVMISIADSGLGMTPKQIASVGAYMQFDRRQHEQQGSGLGLIIAKKITELHGGDFKIESTPGEGTKISMIFEN
jgi:signal transduction histidine kinase